MRREQTAGLSSRDIWACPLEVQRQHGERGPVFIAEQIGALALAGDAAGLETWRSIAARLDQLLVRSDTPQQ